jgi:hypothetical protein
LPSIATAVVSFVLSKIFSKDTTWDFEWGVLLTLLALVATLISLFFSVLWLISVEEQRNFFRVSISKESSEDERHGRTNIAFYNCTSAANRATKSIYVVGPHFSSHMPQGRYSTGHAEYLSKGMREALDRASQLDPREEEGGRQFEYFRVIQMDQAEVDSIRNQSVRWEAVGDASLAEHVAHALDLGREHGSLHVQVFGRSYIPSLPSILVIDERYVFFSLPTLRVPHGDDGDKKPELHYDFVFEIEDLTGDTARNFIRLIKQLERGAVQIQGVIGAPGIAPTIGS